MRTRFFASAAALAAATLALAAAAGCDKPAPAAGEPPAPPVATITVDELDQSLAHHTAQPVDANGDITRRRLGVIPGAVLLTDMDTLDNLPADKSTNLVFYCANTACSASHHAAEKAIVAGYTHVKVLPDGIAGWVKAGKTTQSL